MIVKDESANIERCLASVRDHISTWVICDTGSTDGTQELITNALTGIPGELHERPWVDFGHNRTEAQRLARGKAEYVLVLDADWTLEAEPGALDALDADSYMLRHVGDTEIWTKQLVRDDRDWYWVGAVHEYLETDFAEERSQRLMGARIRKWDIGGGRTGRWERDAALLRAELEREPGNPRAQFYLAQSLRDLGRADDAIVEYEARAELGGWGEEVYWSLVQAGVLKADTGDWPGALETLIRAWDSRPARLEAVYEITWRLRTRELYRAAHQFARVVEGVPPVMPDDVLFVSPWVYRYGLLAEYSITSYWVGDIDGCLTACDTLLAIEDLPPAYVEQTLRNRRLAIDAKARRLADRGLAGRS